jgi:hypothetical protein
MGIPLVQGREFDPRDNAASLPVAIVNETLARRAFFPDNAVGRRIRTGFTGRRYFEIVGIVRDVRHRGPAADAPPQVYVPFEASPERHLTVVARTRGDPRALAGAVRGVVAALDREQPLDSVALMEDLLSGSVARPRAHASLLAAFTVVALVLTALGIYGVVGTMVVERTREIGIRVALGADRADVLGLVMGQSMRRVAAGIVLGWVAASSSAGALDKLLFGIGAHDPFTFVATALVVAAVAAAASFLPARRALSLDPIATLRHE